MKTRKITQLLTLAFAALAFAFVTSCEGPAGPAGTNGTNGVDGIAGADGANGTNGEDGNVTCMECHGVENMETITFQFSSAQHKAGDIAVDYAGGRGSCAECHSHEGFIEWAATGTVAADISDPQAWECSTCHSLHTTFDATDYAFRAGDDVEMVSGTVVAGGNNNTCLNCHKSRRDITAYDNATEAKTYVRKYTDADDIAQYTVAAVGPLGSSILTSYPAPAVDTLVVTFDVPLTYAYISSTHAGPHHGPQGDVWAGENGSVAGTAFDGHAGGCVECHMGPESGHSFKPDTGNCVECHTAGEKDSAMADIAERIQAAGEALELIHAVHYSDGAWHPVYASLEKDEFNAWWDFMVVLEDRSNGAHNPTYVKALLDGIETTLGI